MTEIIVGIIEWSLIGTALLLVVAVAAALIIGLVIDDLCIGQKVEVVRTKHDEIVVKYTPGLILGLVRQTAQVYYKRVDDHWCSFVGGEPQRTSHLKQKMLERLWSEHASAKS